MPDGRSAIQLSKWFVGLMVLAVGGLFGALVRSWVSSDDYKARMYDKVVNERDMLRGERDSVSRENTRLLITWNEKSKEKDDSYNRLLVQQREDNYRRIDSLMQAIYILKYNSDANRKILQSNRTLLKKAIQ